MFRELRTAFLLVCGFIAAAPGLFWLAYGTLDPCEALAARVVQKDRDADGFTRLLGPTVVGVMLSAEGVTPGQCLDLLWRLETGGRPSLP